MKAGKVLCIMPTGNDRRMLIMVRMLQEAGFQVEAVAFKNSHFLIDHLTSCPVQSLGHIYSKIYLFRVFEIMARTLKIRTAIRRSDIVYAFHLEMAMVAQIASVGLSKPVILEIHDIKSHQVSRGFKGWLIRSLDKSVTRACELLVLTTVNYKAYYRDRLNIETPTLIIENKTEESFTKIVRDNVIKLSTSQQLDSRPLRIGYFGLLKDEWSLRLLELVTTTAPEMFTAVLAGANLRLEDFTQRVQQNQNIEYRGEYARLHDLVGLYTDVDVVLACYPPVIPDSWARSHRYYEACFFQKPLIVRAGTGDANHVARHKIGMIITDDDLESAADAVRSVTSVQWDNWRANMEKLPPEVYSYTNEAQCLSRAIKESVG